MRSARMLLATAAATGAIAIATPGVASAAFGGDDGGRDDSSYSRERDSGGDRDKGSGSGRDQEKDYGKEGGDEGGRGEPRGGMHTGGGALASVLRSGDWDSGSDSDSGSGRGDSRFDPESYKGDSGDKGGKGGKGGGDDGGGGGKGDWGDDEEKPRGGMHTGGGALATPGVTAGGLAVLAVGATGMYALRRKKATAPAS
ncbi:hypothetical protein ACGFT2_22525 [Streptomyces sp. NPDC048514]|uniref:hypothetical protein n=1 Tax=Streptomyces sp. NPDC048514 TaxID=3365564 RepID=UPI0037158293